MAFWVFLFNRRSMFYVNTIFALNQCNAFIIAFFIAFVIIRPVKWNLPTDRYEAFLVWFLSALLGILFLYFIISAKRVFAISYIGALFKTCVFALMYLSSVFLVANAVFLLIK